MANFHVGVSDRLCSHGGEFTAHGVIEAGIDFDEIDEDSLTFNTRSQSYTLNLPAPELTSCRIDYIRLMRVSFSMCNPDWDRARTLAEVQAMRDFINESLEDGLLDEAEQRSEVILGEFVSTITGKLVNVSFEKPGSIPKRNPSCHNFSTGEWHYNKAGNIWAEASLDLDVAFPHFRAGTQSDDQIAGARGFGLPKQTHTSDIVQPVALAMIAFVASAGGM